jgi:xanthine dehydrogenase accessory factor
MGRMSLSPYERMAALAEDGHDFAVATVVRTHGSTPQAIGAKLVVTDDPDARPFGTLGGGCVEADAILAAREALAGHGRSLREYRLNEDLDWHTGLVCGGTMWILAERGDTALLCGGQDMLPDLAAAAAGGRPIAVVTRLVRVDRGFAFEARMAVRPDGERTGTLGDPILDERATDAAVAQLDHGPARIVADDETHDLLIEPVVGRPHLVVAGGGHVARAIAQQARLLDFDVTILEDRPAYADPARFEGAAVVAGDVAEGIASMSYGPETFLVVATRGHKMDAECVLAAAGTRARYIGLLGSKRKTILIRDLLDEHGIGQERLDAIHAPVGLDLGGRTPAEIALAILAEITRIRHGGTARPLREASVASAGR